MCFLIMHPASHFLLDAGHDMLVSLLLIFGATNVCYSQEINNDIVQVDIANSSKWIISPYLATIHMLYTNGADGVYNNGTMATWVKENKVRAGRYPGGTTAAYWDWENPCGVMSCWSLDPDFVESQRAPENEWMSIEEYFDFVDETGHGILMLKH